jgi:hypothetical protein
MWTYRVVKTEHKHPVTGEPYGRYFISEVYTGGGYTDAVTVEACDEEEGDDPIASLRWQLTEMLYALDKPVYEPLSDKTDAPAAPE